MSIPLWLGRSQNLGVPSPLSQQQDFASLTCHHDFNKDWSIQQTAFLQAVTMNAPNNAPAEDYRIASRRTRPIVLAPANAVTFLAPLTRINQRQAEYATVVDVTGHFKTGESRTPC